MTSTRVRKKGRSRNRARKKTSRRVRAEALEFVENMERMERQHIPILQGDYAKLH